jgi:hypothetical protein
VIRLSSTTCAPSHGACHACHVGPSRPNCRAHTLAHPSPSPPYHVDSGWSEARGGGGAAPLLTKLDLSGYSFAISWQTLASISRLFPELEELTLSGVDIAGASGAPLEACTRLPSLAPPRLPPPPPPPTPPPPPPHPSLDLPHASHRLTASPPHAVHPGASTAAQATHRQFRTKVQL